MKEKMPTHSIKKYLMLYLGMQAVVLFSCRHQPPGSDLPNALATYDRLILNTDADSIALLYIPDGDLGKMAHGRDSIRKFLLRFKDFHVLEQHSTIDSQSITPDTGFLAGHYQQKVIVPVIDSSNLNHIQDTFLVKGTFRSVWIRLPEHGWHIKKMETRQ